MTAAVVEALPVTNSSKMWLPGNIFGQSLVGRLRNKSRGASRFSNLKSSRCAVATYDDEDKTVKPARKGPATAPQRNANMLQTAATVAAVSGVAVPSGVATAGDKYSEHLRSYSRRRTSDSNKSKESAKNAAAEATKRGKTEETSPRDAEAADTTGLFLNARRQNRRSSRDDRLRARGVTPTHGITLRQFVEDARVLREGGSVPTEREGTFQFPW